MFAGTCSIIMCMVQGKTDNLVPITRSCNTTMEVQAEHFIKKAVIGEGKMVRRITSQDLRQTVCA